MLSPNPVTYTEVVADDVSAACKLYATANGWTFGEPVEALGKARVAKVSDGSRWGVRAPLSDEERPTVRTYLRVDDIEAAVGQAAELGAQIALPPTRLGDEGTIAIYVVCGVEQGIWQLP